MNFAGKTIEDYFLGLQSPAGNNDFPHGRDYVGRYSNNADVMYRDVHPVIEKGAMIIDGGCLNNHGEKHIKTVIQRATKLAESVDELTPYELYVLLMAIHLHDVGNMTGRKGHEQKIDEIIETIQAGTAKLSFQDDVEQECVDEIAESHGGDDHSKMVNLAESTTILNHPVRKRLLASILRFADEISDDSTRANTTLLLAGTLPEEVVLFHHYSYCLKTAEYKPDSKIISYEFRVEEKDLKRTFSKKNREGIVEQVYLIDEIYQRTMKTFLELIFCSKFFRPYIEIDRVRVDVKIKTEAKNERGKSIIKSIQYDIDDLGYYPALDFNTLCPRLSTLTGAVLAQQLTDNTFEDVYAGAK